MLRIEDVRNRRCIRKKRKKKKPERTRKEAGEKNYDKNSKLISYTVLT